MSAPGRRLLARGALACLSLFAAASLVNAAPEGTSAPPAARSAPAPDPAATADAIQGAVRALADFARAHGARAGALVVDLGTGTTLARASEAEPLNPASNAKVLTAAAALDRLGPDFRFTTAVHGTIVDGVVAELVLRGDGDPSLGTGRLWELASAVERQGVTRVDALRVDQSLFDGAYVPPAFEQQPDEWAPFRAPVAAVSLERNAVTLNVMPTREGQPARIWFDPPGIVDVGGTIDTRARGAGQGALLTVTQDAATVRARVGGFVAEGLPRMRFSKRVDDPRPLPARALAHMLRKLGVEVRGAPAVGGEKVRARLAYVESEPLAVLVRELGKNSDNFYAEMIFKALGGKATGSPASSKDGAKAVLDFLARGGPLEPGTRITNGSGLFDANRVSARALVAVLGKGFTDSRLFPDLAASFAVGGVDGTLRSRFPRAASSRAVRAKTGTLDKVVALSGYVLGAHGRAPVAFAFIVDGTARRAEARQLVDQAVDAIARYQLNR